MKGEGYENRQTTSSSHKPPFKFLNKNYAKNEAE
jgi:hypothetical protein